VLLPYYEIAEIRYFEVLAAFDGTLHGLRYELNEINGFFPRESGFVCNPATTSTSFISYLFLF
jgi:hypothetical protein